MQTNEIISLKIIETLLGSAKFFLNSNVVPEFARRFIFDNVAKVFQFGDAIETESLTLGKRTCLSFNQSAQAGRLLYFHGGGYNWGSPQTHLRLVSEICKLANTVGYLLDYRLAPEHPYPAALDDAYLAYLDLLEKGSASEEIIIGGDSAGGGLALALLLKLKEEKKSLPAGVILLSPWSDLTFSGDSVVERESKDAMLTNEGGHIWARNYIGVHNAKNPFISPLFGDYQDMPPMIIHVGENEMLYSDSSRLAEKIKRAGSPVEFKEWPSMFHVFHFFFHYLPSAKDALEELASFMRVILVHNSDA